MKHKTQVSLLALFFTLMMAFYPAAALEGAGLVPLPLVLEGQLLKLATLGDKLAVLSQTARGSSTLSLYQLPEGQKLDSRTLEDQNNTGSYGIQHLGFLQDGRPWLANLASQQLRIFSQDLKEHSVWSFRPAQPAVAAYMMQDGSGLWLYGLDGLLNLLKLPDGSLAPVQPQLPPDWEFVSFLGEKEGLLRCHYTNPSGMSLVVELDGRGQAHLLPVLPGQIYLDARYQLVPGEGYALLGEPGQNGLLQLAPFVLGEHPVGIQGQLLLSASYDENAISLRLYDVLQGLLINRLDIPQDLGELVFSQAFLLEQGRVLLQVDALNGSRQQLYLWDALARPLNHPLHITQTTLADITRENDHLATQIAARNGITLHLRESGASFDNEVYQGQPARNEVRLRDVLHILDGFLDSLPKGLIQEALEPVSARLAIYLSGPITKKSQDGISYPAGFAHQMGSLRYLALNIGEDTIKSTLAHEFMHLLEDRLQLPGEDGSDLLSHWFKLGPSQAPDHGFALAYTDEQGQTFFDTTWTLEAPETQEHPEDVWFIDAYSRTWPIEDRARLFEHLMAPSTFRQPFAYPRLKLKAQVLAALLRQAFPSVARVDRAPWELPGPLLSPLELREALGIGGSNPGK